MQILCLVWRAQRLPSSWWNISLLLKGTTLHKISLSSPILWSKWEYTYENHKYPIIIDLHVCCSSEAYPNFELWHDPFNIKIGLTCKVWQNLYIKVVAVPGMKKIINHDLMLNFFNFENKCVRIIKNTERVYGIITHFMILFRHEKYMMTVSTTANTRRYRLVVDSRKLGLLRSRNASKFPSVKTLIIICQNHKFYVYLYFN